MNSPAKKDAADAAAPKAPPAPKADQALIDANRKASAELAAQVPSKLRDAAAKAAGCRPDQVIGARELEGGAYSVAIATDTGVEKVTTEPKK